MSIDNRKSTAHHSFMAGFVGTFVGVFKDKGVLLMLIIAPIVYGFFYPWPYQNEVVENIPVGIVDYDKSELSHNIIRYSNSSPRLSTRSYTSEAQAQQAMWQGDIAGYLLIPHHIEQDVYANKPAQVSILGNAGYFLLNKYVQTGFTQAVATVSAGIEIKQQVARGGYAKIARHNTQAVPLRIDPLFNPSEGYGAYVVPGVAILILQQTLLMGTALLLGTWAERRLQFASVTGWLGRITAFSVISFSVGCFYYGWVFDSHGYARGHNMGGTLFFFALYSFTVATLGCVLGMWFRQRERSLQILIFSSLPCFFLSGYPWPVSQLPELLQYVRWIIPATSGIHASLQLNQMGASLSQVVLYFYHLLALLVGFFTVLMLMQYRQKRRISQGKSV
ncbi:MAG: ABC transporter [Gammaproteobacteria bacterium]|nr:MAG: ABC transporter [Gammaproteobacteria bacterium]